MREKMYREVITSERTLIEKINIGFSPLRN